MRTPKHSYVRTGLQVRIEKRAIEAALWWLDVTNEQQLKMCWFYRCELCSILNYYKRYSDKQYGFDAYVVYTNTVKIPIKVLENMLGTVRRRRKQWILQNCKN